MSSVMGTNLSLAEETTQAIHPVSRGYSFAIVAYIVHGIPAASQRCCRIRCRPTLLDREHVPRVNPDDPQQVDDLSVQTQTHLSDLGDAEAAERGAGPNHRKHRVAVRLARR